MYLRAKQEKNRPNMLRRIFVLALVAATSIVCYADPGDTLVVQTYTFEEQNNPDTNYDSPGRRWFEFPEDDGTSYQKILMYHTLKCFEDGTAGGLGFPCGEWDYLTYTYLFDHTGELDSNLLTHPQYLLNNQTFETADLSSTPQFNTIQYTYEVADEVAAESAQTYELLGSGGYSASVFTTEFPRSRYQFIYTADELIAMGLTAGEIGRIELEIGIDFSEADIVRLALGSTSQTSIDQWFEGELFEVYANSFSPVGEGWMSFQFNESYMWDGSSSIVLQIATRNEIPQLTTTVNTTDVPGMGIGLAREDRYMLFDNADEVKVPGDAFADLQDEVTIAFWVYGDQAIQPSNSTVFEGVNSQNQRVLNSHLPWGNGRIYWDAGQSGGYDRIDKQAVDSEFEGRWNHYAFTKNAVTGEMKIYLNGELWHSGTDRFRTMEDVVKFSIGSATGWSNYYNGRIDEFNIWKTELDEATINEWMMKSLNDNHPMWGDLLVYYDFNEENGGPVFDQSGNDFHGEVHGAPARIRYDEREIFLNASPIEERPGIRMEQAVSYVISTVTAEYYESQMVPPVALSTWTVDGYSVVVDQIDYYWLPGETYLLDEEGNVLDSFPIIDEFETLNNATLEYFGAPFEVVDRYELGRFITPYGIGLDLEEGWTWVFDVTDYEPLLHGMVELEAGNWQELLDLKFLFIEGTPPREVKRVEAFWKGTYNLNTFDENVTDQQIEILEGEEGFRLKTRASGHGFGTGNNCAEFCYNTHSVEVNGQTQWSWQIMQECADNPLYPQGGTWIYDRAAWCPGAPVATQDLELTPFVAGQESFTVDYDIDYDPDGNYRFEGQVIAYGAPNFTSDVEIEEILAPSDFRIFSRMNPICDDPVIRIRNNGSETLTSCVITYGIGDNLQSYTWSGELEFLETTDVALSYDDPNFWNGDDEEVLVFAAEVSAPNGGSDGNVFNNAATSTFKRPPVYTYGEDDDNRIVVWTKTNNAPWETTVSIETMNGTLVYYRDDFSEANYNYRDTIQLNAGCYKFILSDSGQDGLSFFANNDGNGTCRMKKVGGSTFIQFEPDFGKEIVHYFNFQTDLVAVEEELAEEVGLSLFPNPGSTRINARLRGFNPDVHWQLFDVNGKLLSEGRKVLMKDETLVIPAFDLPAGMYSLLVTDGSRRRSQRWIK